MKQTMHSMGSHGATVDEAETKWESLSAAKIIKARDELKKAVASGYVTEAEAKQELEDNYHAMLEAAKQVESELKQHGVVAHDHHMPVPSSNTHGYTAPISTIPAVPTNAADAKTQYEQEVQRIVAQEKVFLETVQKQLTVEQSQDPTSVEHAEQQWGEQVRKHLEAEQKLLQHLVKTHQMAPAMAEARLEQDYKAARDAAQIVDKLLPAHHTPTSVVHADANWPATPATPATTSTVTSPTTTTTNLRGASAKPTAAEVTNKAATANVKSTVEPQNIVKQPSADSDQISSTVSSNLVAQPPAETPTTRPTDTLHSTGALVGIGVGCVALLGLAVAGVTHANRRSADNRSSAQPIRVTQGSSTSMSTNSPTRAVTQTTFVQ